MSNEKDANEILPNIWLGNYKAAHNANFIYKFNIKYIINVTPDIKNIHKNVNYLQIPIKDLDACPNRDLFEIFEKTSDYIKLSVQNNNSILIHCKNGHHRSAI